MKPLTLSIVIPVFNESNHIKGCLKSISNQVEAPDEVIVVDNNCTDDTIVQAKQFDFVRVVKESKQGGTAARNKGFDEATSDLIGRLNADVVLEKDWVLNIKKAFGDPSVAAVGGVANTHTFTETRGLYTTLWSRLYLLFANAFFRVPILWGANMALRRDAWQAVKNDVCQDDKLVHEDQDISILLSGKGFKAVQDPALLVTTTEWSYHSLPKLTEYFKRAWQTKQYHNQKLTLSHDNVKKRSLSYSIAILSILAIPGLVFYLSSVIYYIFGLIFKPRVKV